MSLFGAIGVSGSGIGAAQTWIDTIAGNLANANDAVATSQGAYAQQTPVFTPTGAPGSVGQGVAVSSVQLGSTIGQIAYQPKSPLADANGNVRLPAVDVAGQLLGLVAAQNAYQANTVAMNRAKQAYQAALTLGS